MAKTERLKSPTRAQKEIMSSARLDWKNWYVLDEDNYSITVISKRSGRRRVIPK